MNLLYVFIEFVLFQVSRTLWAMLLVAMDRGRPSPSRSRSTLVEPVQLMPIDRVIVTVHQLSATRLCPGLIFHHSIRRYGALLMACTALLRHSENRTRSIRRIMDWIEVTTSSIWQESKHLSDIDKTPWASIVRDIPIYQVGSI